MIKDVLQAETQTIARGFKKFDKRLPVEFGKKSCLFTMGVRDRVYLVNNVSKETGT
jgi:hypothetical protein